MSEHTKEPWKFLEPQGVLSCEVVCADGVTIAEVEYEPDAHRIIACVNACEGVTQEMFDGGWSAKGISDYAKNLERQRDVAWKELREIREALGANPEESTADEVRSIVAQRGTLLAALNLIEVDKDGDGFICREAMAQVRAAIAGADRLLVAATESEGGEA